MCKYPRIPAIFVIVVAGKRYYADRELVERIARRIKELRKEHGHSQEYLIEKLHISINSYESGSKTPTLMSVLKICKFYNITLGEFFIPVNYPTYDGK